MFILNKKGRSIVLLDPAEKGNKFACELKNKVRFTNKGEVKKVGLTKEEASYRMGYLAARKDNASAFKSKNKKQNIVNDLTDEDIRRINDSINNLNLSDNFDSFDGYSK